MSGILSHSKLLKMNGQNGKRHEEPRVEIVHRTRMYNASLAMLLNIVQIICGGLLAMFNSIKFSQIQSETDPLRGFANGSLFLLAGAVGLLAAKYKTYGFIIPNLALSVIATLPATSLLVLCSSDLIIESQKQERPPVLWIVINVTALIIAAAELVSCIWVSVLSGSIVCPCKGKDRGGEGKIYTNYMNRKSVGFGITQIVVSILILILSLIKAVFVSEYGPKSWKTILLVTMAASGFLIILGAGILGVLSGVIRTLPLIISHMILCILASLVAGFILFVSPTTILDSVIYEYKTSDHRQMYRDANLSVDVLILLLSLTEFIVSLWSSTLSCRVTCCGAVDSVPPRLYNTYSRLSGLILGTIQIMCGMVELSLLSVCWDIYKYRPELMNGFWISPLLIITGGFGIAAARTKVRSKVMAHGILSILSILLVLKYFGYGMRIVWISQKKHSGEGITVGIMMILIAIVEVVVAVIAVIFCFYATRDDAYRTRANGFPQLQKLQTTPV